MSEHLPRPLRLTKAAAFAKSDEFSGPEARCANARTTWPESHTMLAADDCGPC
jgi:hypothetical protein